ncbi:hypothetical protein CCC_03987 [Paramagnetospirillum magnetotacticum MS-1]|uniref:Uncharacterized protein n=1 Tax=Paramagnetospirillum magnetotacticum MS-1 TaxID=272627 RepID=A0A0C2V307_PARME|nr:hypothetical protein [Paramagnetospirillum magnetotacticum]KIL99471.1 hypothetical protein CCC_03987 [Paramagnetospirillum magnetotacticum MS-1]
MIRAAIAAFLLLLCLPARAETVEGNKIFIEFSYDASSPELEAAEKWGRAHFAKAKAAGRPLRLSVGRSRGTTLISLESVAICDRVKACPLLVFRDLTARPILETSSFQNVLIEYRGTEIFLVIRLWDEITECRITGMGRAKCKKAPKSPLP